MQKTTLEKWGIVRKEPIRPFLTYSIYEGDYPDFAFYFSQIEEWGLLKYCTKLQIYSSKTAPKRIYDSGSVWFLFNIFNETDFVFDWTLDELVCFRQLVNNGNNVYSYPFILINLSNLTYAVINDDLLETLRKDSHDSITGIKTIIGKDAKEEKSFRLNELEWTTLTKLT